MTIYSAISEKNKELIMQYIAKGEHIIEPEWEIFETGTPLEHAIAEGDVGIVAMLLDAGAPMEFSRWKEEISAPHLAVIDGKYEIIELLLKHGMNEDNSRDWDGNTLLHAAAAFGKKNIAEFLMQNGFSLQTKNRDGRTVWTLLDDSIKENENYLKILEKNGDKKKIERCQNSIEKLKDMKKFLESGNVK